LRRIRRILDNENVHKVREIIEAENSLINQKNNILTFHLKTKNIEEVPVRVLIDSGSDLNFIHPSFVRAFGIESSKIEKSIKVTGLGNGIHTVYNETEKCILRFRNHFEVLKFYVLEIPDVDVILGLPWIEKHCPLNYHDARKITFGSCYCASHCNHGKWKRRGKKRNNRKNKDKLVTTEVLIKEEEMPNDTPSLKRKYAWESDEEKDDAEYVRGRRVKTINESDDSDLEDNFMNEFISDSELNCIFNNSDICNSCKNDNSCNNNNNNNMYLNGLV